MNINYFDFGVWHCKLRMDAKASGQMKIRSFEMWIWRGSVGWIKSLMTMC